MFGFGKNNQRKKLAIDMMVIEYTNQGMLPHLAKSMAEQQVNAISKTLKKMPFPMIISVFAWQIHSSTMAELGDEQDEPFIIVLREMRSRYIKGLHKVYDDLDDYDKKILSGVEVQIKIDEHTL
jgi:hypothetical protein